MILKIEFNFSTFFVLIVMKCSNVTNNILLSFVLTIVQYLQTTMMPIIIIINYHNMA